MTPDGSGLPKASNWTDGRWGMGECPQPADCAVCCMGRMTDESMTKLLRNLYTDGVPVSSLATHFDLDSQAIHKHARKKGWHKRRSSNLSAMKGKIAFVAVMNRLKQTEHLYTDQSADRALALLVKLAEKESQPTSETDVGISWEERRARVTVRQHSPEPPTDEW